MADINQLIGLANQMGLVHGIFEKAVSNATKCTTWQDIQASHQAYNSRVVLSLRSIYGTLALLTTCLTGAFIVLLMEGCCLSISAKNLKNSAHRLAWRSQPWGWLALIWTRLRRRPASKFVVVWKEKILISRSTLITLINVRTSSSSTSNHNFWCPFLHKIFFKVIWNDAGYRDNNFCR